MSTLLLRLVRPPQVRRCFSTTPVLRRTRIYTSIRNEFDLHTALRLSTTANTPLITLWTTSYCPSCRSVKAQLEKMFEDRGDELPDLRFVEVELDAQGGNVAELGSRYMVGPPPTSPLLLSLSTPHLHMWGWRTFFMFDNIPERAAGRLWRLSSGR